MFPCDESGGQKEQQQVSRGERNDKEEKDVVFIVDWCSAFSLHGYWNAK
jgi:hypothetical protein